MGFFGQLEVMQIVSKFFIMEYKASLPSLQQSTVKPYSESSIHRPRLQPVSLASNHLFLITLALPFAETPVAICMVHLARQETSFLAGNST
jgi:hypothetical protein